MKAYLKSDRKVIVDVIPYPRCCRWFEAPQYYDKRTKKVYDADELDWVEYYGGQVMKTPLIILLWVVFVAIIGACVVDMVKEIVKRLKDYDTKDQKTKAPYGMVGWLQMGN